ncbi:carboxypeptidase a1 precursor [Penaeus vannamei]|uniref:Carboxypeptidase a1 n=1 Tax=Penaeus vannamei TaxID=6689 RepID=A0A3R7PWW5_PENVA|nr:carboxypeptidase a1 precursor [Penaeus vannamei]
MCSSLPFSPPPCCCFPRLRPPPRPAPSPGSKGSSSAGAEGPQVDPRSQDYVGWKLLRIFPSSRPLLTALVASLRNSSQAVVVQVSQEELLADVGLPPKASLEGVLSSALPSPLPPLRSLDAPDAAHVTPGREDQPRAEKKLDECQGAESPAGEVSLTRSKRRFSLDFLNWKTLPGFVEEKAKLDGSEPLAWDDYYRYDSIRRFALNLSASLPHVEYLDIGRSFEGRPLFALCFASKASDMKKLFKKKLLKLRRLRTKRGRDPDLAVLQKRNLVTRKRKTSKPYVLIEAATAILPPPSPFGHSNRSPLWLPFFIRIFLLCDLFPLPPLLLFPPSPSLILASFQFSIHAREWIAPAVATYLAQELATLGRKFLKRVTVILAPLTNPDGYEYTHTTDRYWRKNRRTTPTPSCPGVDLNRNWGVGWGDPEGSSGDPCSEVYRGPESFSEPETQALRDLALVWMEKIRLYVSLHCMGRVILHPWGFTRAPSTKQRQLARIAKVMAKHLHRNNQTFVFGQTSHVMYTASGTVEDYMHGAGVKYAYTLELPEDSFELEPEKIIPISKAVWNTFLCTLGEIIKTDGIRSFCKTEKATGKLRKKPATKRKKT